MAENIVESLFGPTPWQIQQAQNAQLAQAADKFAAQDPLQRATGQLYRAGGMFANAGADAFGFVNPAVQEAQARQQALNEIDMSSGDSILRAAQGIADPRLKLQLTMLGQQRKAAEQSQMLAMQKEKLAERKQDFTEKEAMDFKRQQLQQAYDLAKERAADARNSAAERVAAQREANQIKLMLGQAMIAMKQSNQGQEKPMTEKERLKFEAQISADFKGVQQIDANMDEMAKAISSVKVAPGLSAREGYTGYLPAAIQGKQAMTAQNRIDTLKGKVTQMGKAIASSSGAIGPMAVQEWKIVSDAVNAIDPRAGNFKEQLDNIERQAIGAANRIKDAYNRQYSAKFEQYPQFDISSSSGKAVSLSAKDQQALDWANANPQDPRANAIKSRLGAK